MSAAGRLEPWASTERREAWLQSPSGERAAWSDYLGSLTPLGRFVVRHGWEPKGPMVPWSRYGGDDYYVRWREAHDYWREFNRARKERQSRWLRQMWRVICAAGVGVQVVAMLAFGVLILAALAGNLAYFGRVIVWGTW